MNLPFLRRKLVNIALPIPLPLSQEFCLHLQVHLDWTLRIRIHLISRTLRPF